MNSREFADRLADRAHAAGIDLDPDLTRRLEIYFRLLATWNERINLTALPLDDPPPQTFDRLLIEPLVAARHVQADAETMLDVGSGGGSPAIPLALAVPRLSLRMVESRVRKAVFLREAIRAVGLAGADVATSRVEELRGQDAAYDLVTLRAVRLDPEVARALRTLLRPTGALFLFGRAGEAGIGPEAPFRVVGSHPLSSELQSELSIYQPS
ncbi:MAG: 16S rRNA (guanine(527)-N(7))-methyltransferase RsmG [Vicinamibacterales bacterium]